MDQGRAIRQIFGEPGGKQGGQDTGAQGEAAQDTANPAASHREAGAAPPA